MIVRVKQERRERDHSEHVRAQEVMGAIPWDDTQPGVEEVVGLLEQAAVVHRHRLHRLGRLMLEGSPLRAVEHEREGAPAEKVAVDIQFGERIPELADGREHVVLDPMNGSGTTTLVAQQCGYLSIGIELNPAMAIIARANDPAFRDQKHLVNLADKVARQASRQR